MSRVRCTGDTVKLGRARGSLAKRRCQASFGRAIIIRRWCICQSSVYLYLGDCFPDSLGSIAYTKYAYCFATASLRRCLCKTAYAYRAQVVPRYILCTAFPEHLLLAAPPNCLHNRELPFPGIPLHIWAVWPMWSITPAVFSRMCV